MDDAEVIVAALYACPCTLAVSLPKMISLYGCPFAHDKCLRIFNMSLSILKGTVTTADAMGCQYTGLPIPSSECWQDMNHAFKGNERKYFIHVTSEDGKKREKPQIQSLP